MTNTAMESALRAARAKKPLAYRGVVLPNKAPIDKIVALCIISMHNSAPLETIEYCATNNIDDLQLTVWNNEGVLPIDVGERKYHNPKTRKASASQWVVDMFAVPESAGLTKALELVNHNNATGALKSYYAAVPFLLREFYELPTEDASWPVRIINAAADVVASFINVENGKTVRDASDEMDADVAALAAKFTQDADKPFTIGRYIRDLWALGVSSSEILNAVKFWQDGMKRLQAERERANKEFKTMRRHEFQAGAYRGIVVHSSDYFLAKAVVRKGCYDIRVIVRNDGHVAISTEQLDVYGLYKELSEREKGAWFHQKQMGAVINGGVQYVGVKPTAFPVSNLVGIIQRHLGQNKKK